MNWATARFGRSQALNGMHEVDGPLLGYEFSAKQNTESAERDSPIGSKAIALYPQPIRLTLPVVVIDAMWCRMQPLIIDSVLVIEAAVCRPNA
jgi:hypothetical protein